MAGDDDVKSHALNSSHDFYELLDLSEGAQETDIRRAYRKTALKYHPDKVGANPEALEKFHILQIAYDVLSDPQIKDLYDNARRARQQKEERNRAYEGRRKWMKEDLERRESGTLKRKREEVDAEEEFERELGRLAEDGKRRRKKREEGLRQEALYMQEEEQKAREGDVIAQATPVANGDVPDIDRSVTLRFPQSESTTNITKEKVVTMFERFGLIEEAILRDKKIKVDGEKHRQPYTTAVLVYKSVVGAHAAVSDFFKAAENDEKLNIFEAVGWAAGKEPDYIPKTPATPIPKMSRSALEPESDIGPAAFQTAVSNGHTGLKKVPSFGSFKGTPAKGSPSLDEMTVIRLKNAERRRMEEKIRREEADAQSPKDQ